MPRRRDRALGIVRPGTGDDGHPPVDLLDRDLDHTTMLRWRQRDRFTRRTAGDNHVHPFANLPLHERAEGHFVDRTIRQEWRDECSAAPRESLRHRCFVLRGQEVAWLAARTSRMVYTAGRRADASQRAAVSAPSAHESLEDLLREGELEGVGVAGERAIISGVVEFGTTKVREVMTPRAEIVAVKAGKLVDAMKACGCTLNNAYMQHSLLALVVMAQAPTC